MIWKIVIITCILGDADEIVVVVDVDAVADDDDENEIDDGLHFLKVVSS